MKHQGRWGGNIVLRSIRQGHVMPIGQHRNINSGTTFLLLTQKLHKKNSQNSTFEAGVKLRGARWWLSFLNDQQLVLWDRPSHQHAEFSSFCRLLRDVRRYGLTESSLPCKQTHPSHNSECVPKGVARNGHRRRITPLSQ